MSTAQADSSYTNLINNVLPEYSVSHLTGFAPPRSNAPAVKFSSSTLSPWLEIALSIPELLSKSNASFRAAVDTLPLLAVPNEAPVEEWRLAYTVLSTIAAAYVWGKESSSVVDRLPYVLAHPLREVSEALEVEPGLTYIAGGIWNHQYRETKLDSEGDDAKISEDAQLDTILSFTGAPDESHFNLTTLRVERAGGEGLVQGLVSSQLIAQAIRRRSFPDHEHNFPSHAHKTDSQPVDNNDSALANIHQALAGALQKMAGSIERCTIELAKMRDGCDPMFFYHQLRPFLSGFGSHSNQPNGVFFPTSADNTQGDWLKLSGATAGQSSLFQAFDEILMVTHPADQDQGPFVKKMRKAIPGCHVQFLESLKSLPSLRSYIQMIQSPEIQTPEALAVLEAYNAAVRALEAFRSEHIKIVTLYVIGPARRAQQTPGEGQTEGKDLKDADDAGLKGTGGSNLAKLLKGMRDDTKRTVLEREK